MEWSPGKALPVVRGSPGTIATDLTEGRLQMATNDTGEPGLGEPVTVYFGERWDAPLLDGRIHQVPTPVGDHCLYCTEPIEAGDRGLLRACIRDNASLNGLTDGSVEPVHLECELRSVIGPVEHLEGRCSCSTRNAGSEAPVTSFRDDARAVLAHINEERRRAGRGPM